MNKFERELRLAMMEHGIQQKDLAEELDLHRETVRYRLRTMNQEKFDSMMAAINRIIERRAV